MTDFINKVITIILIFIMFGCGGLLFANSMNDAKAQMLIMNDVNQFLDKVTDKGEVTQEDLDGLYINTNSHGMVVDVDVERAIRTASLDVNGDVAIVYIPSDDLSVLNHTDAVKVSVTEIGTSPGRTLAFKLLGIDENKFELSLTGSVN